jgi:hypothetical protein
LTDQLSLNTWLELRKLAIDYGKKYFYRHEIYLPFIFLFALVSLLGAFVFLVINIEFSEELKMEVDKMKYFLALNSFVMFFFFYGLLYQGAGINVEFAEHTKILKRNQQIYNDLVFFKEFYFSAASAPDDEEDLDMMEHKNKIPSVMNLDNIDRVIRKNQKALSKIMSMRIINVKPIK